MPSMSHIKSLKEEYDYYISSPSINTENPKIKELFKSIKSIIDKTSSQIDEQNQSIYNIWKNFKKTLNKKNKEEREALEVVHKIQEFHFNLESGEGHGLISDREKKQNEYFENLLFIAEQKGNPCAKLMVGYMYLIGDNVEIDYKKALEWYQKSAELDNVDAIYGLACIYEEGIIVKKDFVKAMNLYQYAINLGSDTSEERLMYLHAMLSQDIY
jgi:TPR repeat protein